MQPEMRLQQVLALGRFFFIGLFWGFWGYWGYWGNWGNWGYWEYWGNWEGYARRAMTVWSPVVGCPIFTCGVLPKGK